MNQIVVGGDGAIELVESLHEAAFSIERVGSPITARALEAAGIDTATMFLLTEADEATSIPVARERNPAVDVVVICGDALPEFASPLADLVVHPSAIDPTVLAEELARRAAGDNATD